MKPKYNYNKFDYIVLVLLTSLAAGGLGGNLQPARVLTIIFFPLLLGNFYKVRNNIKTIFLFFIFWMTYNVLSFFWTLNLSEAIKDTIYFFIHMCLFLEIVVFSIKGNKPLDVILKGWTFAFVLTLPIALYEILTDNHLASSALDSNFYMRVDGLTLQKRFAAVTFGNYNSYGTFLCFTAPFVFGLVTRVKSAKGQIFSYATLLSIFYITLTNASRGAILALAIMTLIFIIHQLSSRAKFNKVIFIIILIIVALLVICLGEHIFQQILFRQANRGLNFLEDGGRLYLIKVSWEAYANSYYMGNGVGSLVSALNSVDDTVVIPPHNFIMELLVQFGFVITILILYFIYKLCKKSFCRKYVMTVRIVLKLATFPVIFIFVINSGYLMMPSIWAYFASLYVFSILGKITYYYTDSNSLY